MSRVWHTLSSGKKVQLPILANWLEFEGANGDLNRLHWLDFTETERDEIANAVARAYQSRKPKKSNKGTGDE